MLTCVPIKVADIRAGDEVAFYYTWQGGNPPFRVGLVEEFRGRGLARCIVMVDYSRECRGDGRHRSFRLNGLRNLCRLEDHDGPPIF